MTFDWTSFGIGAGIIALPVLIYELSLYLKKKGLITKQRKNMICPDCKGDSFVPMAQKPGFYWCFKCGAEKRLGNEEINIIIEKQKLPKENLFDEVLEAQPKKEKAKKVA